MSPRQNFADHLNRLVELAGSPPVKSILRRANMRSGNHPVTAQRFSSWRRGTRLPLSFEAVQPVLEELIAEAQRLSPQPRTTPSGRLDLNWWKKELARAQRRLRPAAALTNVDPFLGNRPFAAPDAPLYFGHTTDKQTLISLVRAALAGLNPPGILLVGDTGSGKSSLAAVALADESVYQVTTTSGSIESHTNTALFPLAPRTDRDTVVVIDHLDQVHGQDNRSLMMAALVDAMTRVPGEAAAMAVVLIVRTDAVERLASLVGADLLDRATVRMNLSETVERDLMNAISGPAALANIVVESGFASTVLADLYSATPHTASSRQAILAHVLHYVWSQRTRSRMSIQTYLEGGRVVGILAAAADTAWSDLAPDTRMIAQDILVSIAAASSPVRVAPSLSYSEILTETGGVGETACVLEHLVRRRVLTTHDGQFLFVSPALPTGWPRLAQWIDHDSHRRQTRRTLQAAAHRWIESGRPAAQLYRGASLDEAVQWISDNTPTDTVQRFIAASDNRRARLRKITAAMVAAAVLAVVAITSVALHQWSVIDHQISDSAFDSMIVESQRLMSSDPAAGEELALAAYRLRPDAAAARDRVMATQSFPSFLDLPTVGGKSLAPLTFSSDATLLVAAPTQTQTLVLLDVSSSAHATETGTIILRGHEARTSPPTLSADSHTLAFVTEHRQIQVWDITDRRAPILRQRISSDQDLVDVRISATGEAVYGLTTDGMLNQWTADSAGGPSIQVQAHLAAGHRLDATPDTSVLLTVGDDSSVKAWTTRDGDSLQQIAALPVDDPQAVTGLEITKDGVQVAIVAGESAKVWAIGDPGSPQLLHTLRLDSPILTLGFFGREIDTIGLDGRILAWDTSVPGAPRPVRTSLETGQQLVVARFDRKDRVATLGANGSSRIWSPPAAHLSNSESRVTSVVSSPSRAILATSQTNGDVTVFTTRGDRTLRREAALHVAAGQDTVVKISDDGRTLLTGSRGAFQLWTLEDVRNPLQHGESQPLGNASLSTLTLSPDGSRVVAVQDSHTLQVWRSDTVKRREVHLPADTHTKPESALFSPDSATLAIAAGGLIYLYDMTHHPEPTLTETLDNHSPSVMNFVFSPDGSWIYAALSNSCLVRWYVGSAAHALTPTATRLGVGEVTSLAIDVQGRTLASGGSSGAVMLWDIGSDDMSIRGSGISIAPADGRDWQLSFDPTDPLALIGADQTTLAEWSLDPAAIAQMICEHDHLDRKTHESVATKYIDIALCP